MKILAFETSCDETAVALVQVDGVGAATNKVVSERIYSQYKEHFDYGGVVPEIASRAHLERLPTLLKETLEEAETSADGIDGIVATTGPGLTGGLLMGTVFAKTLSMAWDKPFMGINHIEGHALSPLLTEPELNFPYLLLLVSGGHCQIVRVDGVGDYTTLGATRDDAAGECFDKAARVLGLGHPGGPAVEKAAQKGDARAFHFSVPKVEGLDFSFSGLKTAVLREARALKEANALMDEAVADLSAALQATIAKHLASKVKRALEETNLKNLVVAGGVAANQTIRDALEEVADKRQARLFAPPLSMCTDNAAMIGLVGGLRLPHNKNRDLTASVRPRWPLDEMESFEVEE